MSRSKIEVTHWAKVLQRKVPSEYLDRMEHVGVASYGLIFADAAWAFFEHVGMTPKHFQVNHSGTFALEQHIKFVREIVADEIINVYAASLSRSARRVHYALVLMNAKGKLSAVSEFVNVYIDLNTRKPRDFPPDIATNLDNCNIDADTALSSLLCGAMRA